MQRCEGDKLLRDMLPLITNIATLQMDSLRITRKLPKLLSCAPFLRRIEVENIVCGLDIDEAFQNLKALRSISQSISWGPFELRLEHPHARTALLDLCSAIAGTRLASAVSTLTLYTWRRFEIEAPIVELAATFPDVSHFEIDTVHSRCDTALTEATTAWPSLRSIDFASHGSSEAQEAQQGLEAVARTAAKLKAGQPFEIVLKAYYSVNEGDAVWYNAVVAAVQSAGGGRVGVRWMRSGS